MEQFNIMPPTSNPTEWSEVERPLLQQLIAMGWQYLEGDCDYPQKTFRDNFRQVLLLPKLRDAIRRINLDEDGNEYLDDLTIERAIAELQRAGTTGLLQANKNLTEKLIKGVHVPRAEGGDPSRQATIRFIDFAPDHLDRNEFLAMNQFRVDMIGRTSFCIPDVVLFVNGIPLVVIECKSPSITEPMNAGINQLLRYSNNRPEVEEDEGIEHLFRYNQIIVSTYFYEARAAAVCAGYDFYLEWKDTSPVPNSQVLTELGKTDTQIKSQELLTAGMLRPSHLLDILNNFI
ncbi:type I restriction endonuclease subunit R, partial [Candidatus Pacearchaeota archaeon]|nr:type I restriction endonuclease subunit R [Candidatus Pacearchaeota archaeon]